MERFVSDINKKYKIQGYFELKNYQTSELVELENTSVSLAYECVC